MVADTTVPARGRRKSMALAVLLQCIPLLGAAGCIAEGANGSNVAGVLGWSLLFWGIGYLYLGRRLRAPLTILAGSVFAFASCTAFVLTRTDFEHPYDYTPATKQEAITGNRPDYLEEGLLIVSAVLLLAVDAWRLTAAHNAALERDEDQSIGPPLGEA